MFEGREELDSGKLLLRDMSSGEQEALTLEEIEGRLGQMVSGASRR